MRSPTFWEAAEYFPAEDIISVHFPVGRFPTLYQEDETTRSPFVRLAPCNRTDYMAQHQPRGYAVSRFSLALKRAVWVSQGRRKQFVTVEDFLCTL